jgi:glutaminyl-peptide cyclotransferase
VLNGIAYDAQHDRLFVTGKQWPTVFEIKVAAHTKAKSRSSE